MAVLEVEFDFTAVGLTVKFTNLTNVPEGCEVLWDFGDGNTSNEETEVTHTYDKPGVYRVILSFTKNGSTVANGSSDVVVSDVVQTTLPDTIYNLIDTYIPENIFGKLSNKTKRLFISKWQLYIQPLVDHEVPLIEVYNEGYYEALENQLIMEMAAYDYMMVDLANLYKASAHYIYERKQTSSEGADDEEHSDKDIKHITTGPTEVEYFDPNASDADLIAAINKAMAPGGIIDTLRANLCMLASRLDIFLPICAAPARQPVAPNVVNRRVPGPLDGPDPALPVNTGGITIPPPNA